MARESRNSGEAREYPRKWWWLILFVLPIVAALIPSVVPNLFPNRRPKKEAGVTIQGNHIFGDANGITVVDGNNNVVQVDSSKKTFLINAAGIEKEYQDKFNAELSVADKRQIEEALDNIRRGNVRESVAPLQELNQRYALPALQNNIAVAYSDLGDWGNATKILSEITQTDSSYAPAKYNLEVIQILPRLESETRSISDIPSEARGENVGAKVSPSPTIPRVSPIHPGHGLEKQNAPTPTDNFALETATMIQLGWTETYRVEKLQQTAGQQLIVPKTDRPYGTRYYQFTSGPLSRIRLRIYMKGVSTVNVSLFAKDGSRLKSGNFGPLDNTRDFDVQPGTQYYLSLDESHTQEGEVTFDLTRAP